MPDKVIPNLDSEVADTIAYYVKADLILQGFFCRKRQNRRESTFAIQAAENESMPNLTDETR